VFLFLAALYDKAGSDSVEVLFAAAVVKFARCEAVTCATYLHNFIRRSGLVTLIGLAAKNAI